MSYFHSGITSITQSLHTVFPLNPPASCNENKLAVTNKWYDVCVLVCIILTAEDQAPGLSYSVSLCERGTKYRFLLLLRSFRYYSITCILSHDVTYLCAIQTHSANLNYRLFVRKIHHHPLSL